MSIPVRLDHRDDLRGGVASEYGADSAKVGRHGVEIDVGVSRSDHGTDRFCRRARSKRRYSYEAARLENVVYGFTKASLTTPVGPLRCLPTMISANPSSSGLSS